MRDPVQDVELLNLCLLLHFPVHFGFEPPKPLSESSGAYEPSNFKQADRVIVKI